MTYTERPEGVRVLSIVAYMEAHHELDYPTITPSAVHWHITGRPIMEAAVLAVCDNWKVLDRGRDTVALVGFHPVLNEVIATLDRYEAGPAERDWSALGVAEQSDVAVTS